MKTRKSDEGEYFEKKFNFWSRKMSAAEIKKILEYPLRHLASIFQVYFVLCCI